MQSVSKYQCYLLLYTKLPQRKTDLEKSDCLPSSIVQSYSNRASMVLAQKQKYRPMEQDRKPRNKPMHLWVSYFSQRRQEYTMGQRQPIQ